MALLPLPAVSTSCQDFTLMPVDVRTLFTPVYCILFQTSHQLDWYGHLFWLKFSRLSLYSVPPALQGAGCAPPWRFFFFFFHRSYSVHSPSLLLSPSVSPSLLINSLMYGCRAKAKAYGNPLSSSSAELWELSHSVIQLVPRCWPSLWTYCLCGHTDTDQCVFVCTHTYVCTCRIWNKKNAN